MIAANDASFVSATSLAQAILNGETTAQEAVAQCLDRIARINPQLNAIVTLDAEGARQRAAEADAARARGEIWGSLHGVPITIKDSFDTAGLRTTAGFKPFADRVPREDAVAVARLRKAGAIILGKTNLPELANGIQTNNRVFGRTNNPFDLARTPGGSSGGAAAAVAAGMSYLDLGSDIGGSIRIPAHFCGICGLKPTGGSVPGRGHVATARPLAVPREWLPLAEMATFGPIARCVADLRLAYRVIAMTNGSTPAIDRRLRIAWTDDFGGTPVSREYQAIIAAFIDAQRCAGHDTVRTDAGLDFPDAWDLSGQCLGLMNTLFQSPTRRWLRRLASPLLRRVGPRSAMMEGLFVGLALRPRDAENVVRRRAALIERIDTFLQGLDAWICPVFPVPAFTHRSAKAPIEIDDSRLPQIEANLRHEIIFNVSGNPVVVVPIGRTGGGLPVGVQVIGRRFADLRLLDVVERVVEARSAEPCAAGPLDVP